MALAQKMRVKELSDLGPQLLLECMTKLCSKLLDGQSILDYREDISKQLSQAWSGPQLILMTVNTRDS